VFPEKEIFCRLPGGGVWRLHLASPSALQHRARSLDWASSPLTPAVRVLPGLPGARREPCSRASEHDRARTARLLRVAARAGPLAGAAHPLSPPLPALPGALPRHRPDAHVAAAGSQLAGPLAQRLAHTADCGRAHNPRARRGWPGGDQRLSRPGNPARCPRSAAGGSGIGPRRRRQLGARGRRCLECGSVSACAGGS
jgi:hypothetical protein